MKHLTQENSIFMTDRSSQTSSQQPWLHNLPRSAGTVALQATAGQLKATVEDFVVEEIPAYVPCGEGEHLFLRVKKWGLNTADLVRGLAVAFGVDPMAVGSAGLKDKHAITTQWLSVHVPGRTEHGEALAAFVEAMSGGDAGGGVEVLEAKAHGNKLRTGQLDGNRFQVVVRGLRWGQGLEGAELGAALESALASVRRVGFINYFGAQRFGRGGENVARGLRKLNAGRRGRDRNEKLMLSAAQSAIFNVYAARRAVRFVAEGGGEVGGGEVGGEVGEGLRRVLVGDVLKKVASGGEFVCVDAPTDQRRVDEGELVITGPLPGNKVRQAQGEPLGWEVEALGVLGLTPGQIHASGKVLMGARRPLLVRPGELEATWLVPGEQLRLSFVLPPGSYATMFLYDLLGLRDTEGAAAGQPSEPIDDTTTAMAATTTATDNG